MLLHLLAIPLGMVALIILIVIAGLIANFPKEVFGIVVLLLITYWLGANILRLV